MYEQGRVLLTTRLSVIFRSEERLRPSGEARLENGSRLNMRMPTRKRLGIRCERKPLDERVPADCGATTHARTAGDTDSEPYICGCVSRVANLNPPADFYCSTTIGDPYLYKSCQFHIQPVHINTGNCYPWFDWPRRHSPDILPAALNQVIPL